MALHPSRPRRPVVQGAFAAPADGFEVVDLEIGVGGRRRRVVHLAARGLAWRPIEPRPAPALLRELVALDESDASAIAAFASIHGPLGGLSNAEKAAIEGFAYDEKGPLVPVEPVAVWRRHVPRLRLALGLLDARARRDQAQLRRWIAWNQRGAVLTWASNARKPTEKSWRALPESFGEHLDSGKVLDAAAFFAQVLASDALESVTQGRLVYDVESKTVGLTVQPTALLGAAWLELAELLVGDVEDRACEGCNRWFRVGGQDTSRADRRFCPQNHESGTCRQRATYRRRREARRLAEAGTSPAAIARAIGSDVRTVRKWIRRTTPGRRAAST